MRFADFGVDGVAGFFDSSPTDGSARERVLMAAIAGAARTAWPAVLRKRRRAGRLLLELLDMRSCFRVLIPVRCLGSIFKIYVWELSKDVSGAGDLTKILWDSYETFMGMIRLFYSAAGVMCLLADG